MNDVPFFPGGGDYIYFNSLFKLNNPEALATAQAAESILGINYTPGIGATANISSKKNLIINFLNQAITSEANKEKAYIKYMLSKQEYIPDVVIEALKNNNWKGFVAAIQIALTDIKTAKEIFLFEKQRLEQNQNQEKRILAQYENEEDITKASRQRHLTLSDAIQKRMASLGNAMFKGGASSSAKVISDYILKYFNDDLLVELDEKYQLKIKNPKEFAGVFLAIAQDVITDYELAVKTDPEIIKFINEAGKRISINSLVENEKGQKVSFFEYVVSRNQERHKQNLERLNNLGEFGKRIMEQYTATSQKDQLSQSGIPKKRVRAGKGQFDKLGQDGQIKTGDLFNVFTKMTNMGTLKIPSTAVLLNINQNRNAFSEIQASVTTMMNGMVGPGAIGKKGAKTDILVGSIGANLSNIEGELKKIVEDKINNANRELEKKLNKLGRELKGTNTSQYMRDTNKNWSNTIKEIDKIVAELNQVEGMLSHCYILDGSVKNYLTLGLTGTPNSYDTFKGGSLGPNLIEILEKYQTLSSMAGINFDLQSGIKNALLNAGPGMIGQANRETLEDYLAAIAGLLMFDDSISIMTDAMSISSSQTSTSVIHLFILDTGYLPLSVILSFIRDELEISFFREESLAEISSGIDVSITGFAKHPPKFNTPKNPQHLTEAAWKNLYSDAEKSLKITINIARDFLKIIQDLAELNF